MKVVISVVFLVLTSFVSGNPLGKDAGSSNPKNFQDPEIGVTSKASLGQNMISQAYGWLVDCITPKETKTIVIRGLQLVEAEIKSNIRICGEAGGGNSFVPTYKLTSNDTINTRYGNVLVEVKNEDETSELCMAYNLGVCVTYAESKLERSKAFKTKADSLQQSITYMGRDGGILKFLYVESKNDIQRPEFNRDFLVDLTETPILSVKGAQVEIIEATDTDIKYRVIKYFE